MDNGQVQVKEPDDEPIEGHLRESVGRELVKAVGIEPMRDLLNTISRRLFKNYYTYGFQFARLMNKYPHLDTFAAHTLCKPYDNTEKLCAEEFKVLGLFVPAPQVAETEVRAFEQGWQDYLIRHQIKRSQLN